MIKKSGMNRRLAIIFALALTVVMSLPSLGTMRSFADDTSQASGQTEQTEQTEQKVPEQTETTEQKATDQSGVSGSENSASTDTSSSGSTTSNKSGTPTYDKSDIGELKLVYGDSSLSDDDAFVLLIFGDGFTSSQQADFYKRLLQGGHKHGKLHYGDISI